MVQNTAKPRRGRPRAYDPDAALAKALGVFWDAGYSATSLDELSAATGMNRPSLYGAFGDKRALYGQALARYRAGARAAMKQALDPERPLAEGLRRVYAAALESYLPAGAPARGCFMIGTAVTEAAQDAAVRESLREGLREIDRAFEARIRLAQRRGEAARAGDPAMLARLASAALYWLAIRARAGEPRAALERVAEDAVALLCAERSE
jgi:AcrR family transcriptional regulator